MRTLDNAPSRRSLWRSSVVQTVIFVSVCAALATGASCRKQSVEAPAEVESRPVSTSISEADALYSQRSDLTKVRQALVVLRQAMAEHPTDYGIAWRLAKFNYYVGSHSADREQQDKVFHDGIEAGELAIKLDDNKPEGHFWLGANYGGNAEISTLAGLTDIEDIKREMDAVIKIDPSFESGSAYMALGQVYLKAPKIFGGDTDKAIGYLEQGIKIGPNNGLMRARLAQAYFAAHRNADAQKEIDALLSMKPIPGYEPEYNDAVRIAKELQEKMKQ
jgi:tetratricopeptide (TPR) repeat protein